MAFFALFALVLALVAADENVMRRHQFINAAGGIEAVHGHKGHKGHKGHIVVDDHGAGHGAGEIYGEGEMDDVENDNEEREFAITDTDDDEREFAIPETPDEDQARELTQPNQETDQDDGEHKVNPTVTYKKHHRHAGDEELPGRPQYDFEETDQDDGERKANLTVAHKKKRKIYQDDEDDEDVEILSQPQVKNQDDGERKANLTVAHKENHQDEKDEKVQGGSQPQVKNQDDGERKANLTVARKGNLQDKEDEAFPSEEARLLHDIAEQKRSMKEAAAKAAASSRKLAHLEDEHASKLEALIS